MQISQFLFDGGSQNTPRAYWVFKAFATDNETLSAGIMRMLSSSGDDSLFNPRKLH